MTDQETNTSSDEADILEEKQNLNSSMAERKKN